LTLLLGVWKTNKKTIITEGVSLVFGILKKIITKKEKKETPSVARRSPLTVSSIKTGKNISRFYKTPVDPKTYGQNKAHHRKPLQRLKNAE